MGNHREQTLIDRLICDSRTTRGSVLIREREIEEDWNLAETNTDERTNEERMTAEKTAESEEERTKSPLMSEADEMGEIIGRPVMGTGERPVMGEPAEIEEMTESPVMGTAVAKRHGAHRPAITQRIERDRATPHQNEGATKQADFSPLLVPDGTEGKCSQRRGNAPFQTVSLSPLSICGRFAVVWDSFFPSACLRGHSNRVGCCGAILLTDVCCRAYQQDLFN